MTRDKPRAEVRDLVNDYADAYTFLRLLGRSREYAEAVATQILENRINLAHGRPDLVRERPEERQAMDDRR